MKAHQVLSDESKWTKGAMARDDRGLVIGAHSEKAVCFCVVGALDRAYGGLIYTDRELVTHLVEYLRELGYYGIGNWNDAPERTFTEVRDLLTKLDI